VAAGPTTTGTATYASLLHKYVSAALLSLLRAGLPHLPAGVVTFDAYQKGTDDSYTYGAIPDLDVNMQVLAEGVTPTAENIQSLITTFSTAEYGRVVTGTDKIIRTQPYDWAGTVAERVAFSAAEHADEAARLIWQAVHAGEIILGAGTAAMGTDLVTKAVTALQERDVPPAAGGLYVGIAHPRAIAALKMEVGERSWTDAAKYDDPNAVMTGHLGDWGGVRWVGNSRVAITGTTTKISQAIIAGANALVFADPGSIMTSAILPTPSITDPLAQRSAFGWRGRWGGAVLPRRKRQADANDVFSYVKLSTLAPDPTV
jgi:N4-gp56 family major capsid protein